jgi:NUMOD3 motif
MSAETRARMSQARFGRNPWNKGRRLSEGHRTAIAASSRGVTREISPATRKRLRMARRRPGDAIVAGGVPSSTENGEYPLVETTDINLYVTLRRELRTWSDEFAGRNGRRPSLVDVRRIAPPDVIGKFERYVGMRDRLRGLAADVYGTINPDCVPSVRPSQIASTPQNNNQGSILRYTSHGNARLVPKGRPDGVFVERAKVEAAGASAARRDIEKPGKLGTWGQWDAYDLPTRGDYSSGFQVSETVRQGLESDERAFTAAAERTERVPKKEAKRAGLSANDYRAIGKYRLMESIDINRYVQLRRDLMAWSSAFKEKHGHTPTLSDVQAAGDPSMYRRFREYIETRDRMDGLVKEVCGAEIDDLEQIKELSDTGRALVDQLRPSTKVERSTPAEPASSLESVGRLTALSPPSIKEL